MNDKMVRFLKSIQLENYDDYDMDFELVARDRFNHEKWNMVIVKKTPWDYHLLREFIDALSNIHYEYSLRFSYLELPKNEDFICLFDEWYRTLYHVKHHYRVSFIDEGIARISYTSQKEKEQNAAIIKDFKDFLSFINYEFVISEEVGEQTEAKPDPDEIKIEPSIHKTEEPVSETAPIEEEASSLESDEPLPSFDEEPPEIEETEPDNEEINEEEKEDQEILKAAKEEHQKEMNADADELMALMKKNLEEMAKERERYRLRVRGNYTVHDLIDSIDSNSGNVEFVGKVFSMEESEFAGVKRLTLGVNDKAGGAIKVRIKQTASLPDNVVAALKGSNVRVRGVSHIDEYSKQLQIHGHYVDILPPDEISPDPEEKKRVELHLHSHMSTQDGINNMDTYARYAKALGHTAMAVTDHGVIQAFPEAQKAAKDYGIKMLYGCEFYMVDDELHYVKNKAPIELNKATFVVLDLETTGFSARYNQIIEFGAVKVEGGTVTSRLDILINPGIKLSEKIKNLTGIDDELLKGKPLIKEAFPEILDYIKDAVLVTHNADFDFSFLDENAVRLGYGHLKNPVIDTLSLSRYIFPSSRNHNLGSLCRNLEVRYDEESAHRADYDAEVLNDVWQPMLVILTKDNPHLLHQDLADLKTPKELIKHMRPLHLIALVKNKEGLRDLNILVSKANVEYLADLPKIPRREIAALRKNLLIGSACFNGEVHRTARYYNKDTLKQVISFYDYIEVQPPENYSFLVHMDEIDPDDVNKYIRDIIEAADEVGKPVVATGDVHYVTPNEKIFRDVYISSQAVGGKNHDLNPYGRKYKPHFENPDQHYRTTREMLDAFSFLPKEKAYEIVVTNTNRIADSIDSLLPVPNDHLYTPIIDNVDNMLHDSCYQHAKELYGDPLPEFIDQRLKVELNGIISHGYAVIYYIAQQLVKKANEDGYIVGSRGSVGSSFVATMSGITEVNALPPHYRCPKCRHFEWGKDSVPDIRSGYDLPEKNCPVCGTKMVGDGQNIPFETFLGFAADKTPDIDLNFPGDYQATAHEYTKVLLGKDNVFRAGTIETVAEKTAFGFARGFVERNGYDLATYPRAKIEYLASGCVDVKRTTGQHPGGIVVIPADHEVYDFTPIQYPADEPDSAWRTTHYDYNAIHDTILKLDMLGHVDPMALKMMSDLTGVKIKEIPLNDKKALSLFSSPDALGLKGNYLQQKTGAMGIPEFGTNFVRGMLEATLPKNFADLVIISGLSHGTDVWIGNADELIKNGVANLQEVIGCRDDIMTYLIGKGLPPNSSFKIMEDVRKGRHLKPEQIDMMHEHNVPQFYIDSCNKIKYLFPKGHAVAYVTQAVRVAYFKIYYPLEYYATFFSVRCKQYDIEAMIKGEKAIIARYDYLENKNKNKSEKLLPKEEEQIKTLRVAIEMVQRGFSFENIDLYRSDATKFIVDHERKALIPPFVTLDGLGDNNAVTVVEARENGRFTSKEDLLRRTKLTQTNVQDLTALGALDDLGDSDQLSLFDF